MVQNKKTSFWRTLGAGILILLCEAGARAQGLEQVLAHYRGANGQGFVQPLSDVLANTLHSQIFGAAGSPERISLDIRLITPVAFITSAQKTFQGTTPPGFEPAMQVEAPTVLGSSEPRSVMGVNGTSYTFPGGLGTKFIWLAVPQVQVGGVLGTEFSLRFFAFEPGEDLGKIQLFGLGLRHDLSRYLEDPPVRFSLAYAFNHVDFADYLHVRNQLAAAYIGQDFKAFNYYGLVGYQRNNTRLRLKVDEESLSYDIDNENPLLLGLGLGFRLAFIQFSAEVNGPRPLVASAGLGFHF